LQIFWISGFSTHHINRSKISTLSWLLLFIKSSPSHAC
jgi:hypothetical protein